MEDGDLLGFDAPQEEAWDDRSTSQSDRASSSTYGDVPSFAKPPKLETQESVNLMDFGGSQVDSDQASVNLLEFTVSPVNMRVDLMSSELPLPTAQQQEPFPDNSSMPVDVYAATPSTTTTTPALPFELKPTMNSNIDVFADMVRTAKEMDAKTSPNSHTNAHPQSMETNQEPSPSTPPPSNHVVQETTDSKPQKSQTIDTNQQVNGKPSWLSTISPEENVALEDAQKKVPSSSKNENMVSTAGPDASCADNTIEPLGTTEEQQSPRITDHNGLDPTTPPTSDLSPNSKSDHQELAPPTTTNGPPLSESKNSTLVDEGQHDRREQTFSSPTEGNPSPDTGVAISPTTPPAPLVSPQKPVGDISSASHVSETISSGHETPISPTIVDIPTNQDNSEPSTMTNGKKELVETIVTIPNLPTDTNPQSPQATTSTEVDQSNSSPQTTNDMGDVSSHNQQEPTNAATTSPLSPDPSKEDTNQIELLNKIQALEQQLHQAQSTILQLEEKHAKDEQDATAHGKLLVELQTNLQSQMNLRAEAEEKVRRATMIAKTYKEKLEALQVESKESMEQLGATLGKITAAKSTMEMELETVKKERDDKVRREATMALQLNVISKKVAEKANSAEYYENQVDQLKQELESTKTTLSQTTHERDHFKEELTEWKEYAEKRSKQLEAALAKEKKLNDERKRKMKQFVEMKSEEVRVAKADCAALQSEIDQTNMAVKDMNQRYKQLHAQWVESQTRNRELQRDLTKMQKDSEKMSKVGGTLEAKLSRSAMESEDHKNKRLAAKNELMAVLRQLEAERDVNNRLRERIKMTFTPKVLHQQQSIREILDRFEDTMLKVATKLGRPLPPPPDQENDLAEIAMDGVDGALPMTDSAAGVSEANMQRVLARLEHETKRVSQSIESISGSVLRLNSLVAAPSTRGCVDVFSAMLMTTSHT